MPFSIELELEDGGHVTYDNVIAYTVEEADTEDEDIEEEVDATESELEETEPSPDEIPEDGDEEREGNTEVE